MINLNTYSTKTKFENDYIMWWIIGSKSIPFWQQSSKNSRDLMELLHGQRFVAILVESFWWRWFWSHHVDVLIELIKLKQRFYDNYREIYTYIHFKYVNSVNNLQKYNRKCKEFNDCNGNLIGFNGNCIVGCYGNK